MKIAIVGLFILTLFPNIVFAEVAREESFKGTLKPEQHMMQRAITLGGQPVAGYEDYRYVGNFENDSGYSYFVYYNENFNCKGSIEVQGKSITFSFDNCAEPGQAKCSDSAAQLYAQSLKCVN